MKLLGVKYNGMHVKALLRKDYLVRKRQWLMTLVQYLWPCIIFLSLYVLRNRFRAYTADECQFPTRQLPSTNNLLPFFQSYICTIENKCLSPDQYHETPDYEAAPVTPILNIVQTFLNEEKLYNAIIKLPIDKNFIGTVITIVTHPSFRYIESNGKQLSKFLPEIEKIVGANFEPTSLFSDSRTFSNFGKIICASPFPRADNNLRIVNNVLNSEDFNGADSREIRALPTDYCKKLYMDVTNSNQGKITWSHLKPLIQGKILYGPDNERTREIMKHANITFDDMARLGSFLRSVDTTFELLKSDPEFREKYDQLIRLAKNPLVTQLAGDSFNAAEVEATLNGILNDKRIASTIKVIANIFDCYSVDRYVPVDSEAELEDRAYELADDKLLYAAIYFTEEGGNRTTYKLRMNTDDTPVTALTRNRFWFPGPEGNFAMDMRYHRGFVQIQHTLDMAIIEVEKGKRTEVEDSTEALFPLWDSASSTTPAEADGFGEFEDEDEDEDGFGEFEDDTLPVISLKNATEPATSQKPPSSTTEFDEDLDFSSTETVTETVPPVPSRKRRQVNLLQTFFGNRNTAKTVNISDMKFFTKQFPYPAYETDDFKKGLYMAQAIQIAFFFALIVQVASSVRHRIWMKESGNSTLMRTMGLVKSAEVVAWVLTSLIELAIIFAIVLFVMYLGGILTYSSKWLLYVFLLFFGCSVVAFCFMTSTFFSSASIGTVSSVIFFLITFLPYIIVVSLGTFFSAKAKFLASLSVSTAFCYAWRYIFRVELQNKPFTISNAFSGDIEDNDFKFGCLMIVVDLILYAVIGALCETFLRDDNNFHEVSRRNINKEHGAEVSGVTKVYDNAGGRKAVDNVSLVLKRDQVTALLGRNGAGKSTIIKMLTGQLKPTQGEITLPPNYDLISGNKNNQERIGLCAQNNILIPNLTAREHLELYARIKMRSGFDSEIKRVFNNLNFGKYKSYQAKELSGGYKRRLCIAIAFLASPNLVILDEPCSGVDTKARKNIWDLIQLLRKGRAVVLATHFMDEAEQLSDKIVIINQGKIVSETSLEGLTHEFTKSFELTIHLSPAHDEKERNSRASLIEGIRSSIKETIPGTHVGGSSSSNYTLNVPYKRESGEYYSFEAVIKSLERLQMQKKILGFNITTQNLKDVFNRYNSYELNGNHNGEINGNSEIPMKEMEEEKEVSWLGLVASLFWKRWTHFTRNYRMLLCMLVLPVVFECIAMLFLKIRPPGEYDVALPLGKDLYPRSTEFYSYEELENDTASSYTRPVYDDLSGSCGDSCSLFSSSLEAHKWLLETNGDYIEKRYGGIVVNGSRLGVWYNNKGYHSMASYLNVLNNALLRRELNDSWHKITAVNHPLKLGDDGLNYSSILQQVADAGISLIILVAFSLVLAGASVYIVNERVNGEKLQQRLCGVSFRTYWGVTYVWDFLIYGIALASAAVVFELFGIPLYVDKEQLPGICLLLFLFGFATIPAIHVFEKLFSEPSFANMSLFCLNVIIALSTMVIVLVLEVLAESDEDEEFRKNLNRVFLVLPQHALSDGLRQIVQNYIVSKVFERFYIDSYKSPVTSDLLRSHFLSLFCVGIFLNVVNFIIESKIVQRLFTRSEDDEGSTVATELEFVSIQNTLKPLDTYDMARTNCALSVQSLRKKYHGHSDFAVKNVSFHVKDGECFGLLGANGAGKSTIFAILCGEILQTSGQVKLRRERGVSYCPQSNALDPLLTVTEVIQFYGRLRKIRDLKQLTSKTLDSLHLAQYRNVLVKNLSGGNRRKLSVAVTCFGNTNLVLMDEPTSDMDPITRGLVYKVIKGLIKSNRAVVLTSHSISEIESLCHRISVLKEGKVLSTGTPRQLKDSYGNSYLVNLFSSKASKEDIDISATFPTATRILKHNHSTQFMIKVKFNEDDIENGDITAMQQADSSEESRKILLSDLFAKLDSLRVSHNIMYTVSECLLDQVLETILDSGEPEQRGYVNKAYKQTETSSA